MIEAPQAVSGQEVLGGPEKHGSELRWELRLPDGRLAVLAQLLPEAASELSLRRRYVFEAERIAALKMDVVAETLALGPTPDARALSAEAPWRLRVQPEGQTVETWLERFSPASTDAVISLWAKLADAVHRVHSEGVILRELDPSVIVLTEEGTPIFTDFGLTRVDILSSHTASSIIMQTSPYAAPEHLRQNTVDARADVYSLAAMMWQALTGVLPFAERGLFISQREPLPDLASLCPSAPDGLDTILRRALSETLEDRPASARAFAAMLRGEEFLGDTRLARVQCQNCGAMMEPGLRLCLACGSEAVQFHSAEGKGRMSLLLTAAKDTEEFDEKLRAQLGIVTENLPDNLNFVVGDQRMYSRAELKERVALPALLLENLTLESAEALKKRLVEDGFKIKLRRGDHYDRMTRRGKWWVRGGLGTLAVGIGLAVALHPAWLVLGAVGGVGAIVGAAIKGTAKKGREKSALATLRAAPLALPASDPLVARVAEVLRTCDDPTLRETLQGLALLLQRLCDHRAALAGDSAEAKDLSMLVEPLSPLVDLIEAQAKTLIQIHTELGELDEAAIVRGIASSEARGEPETRREPLLEGLDRLRALEERRAEHLQSLLEASTLLEHVVNMGLEVRNPKQLADNYTQMAIAALGDGSIS